MQMVNGSNTCPLCGGGKSFHFMTAPDRFHWRTHLYELKRCDSCTCVWLVGPPTPQDMPVHYDDDYHRTIAAGGEGSPEKRWRGPRETILKYKNSGSILDIGCSSGGFLGTMNNGYWRLHGIEIERATAERAINATGAEVFVGDVLDAPFRSEEHT